MSDARRISVRSSAFGNFTAAIDIGWFKEDFSRVREVSFFASEKQIIFGVLSNSTWTPGFLTLEDALFFREKLDEAIVLAELSNEVKSE